jgi:hypothetical protein
MGTRTALASRRSTPRIRVVAVAVALLVVAVGCSSSSSTSSSATTSLPGSSPGYPRDGELKLNQLQVLGTHNSYHIAPKEPLFSAIKAAAPDEARTIEYTHDPLDVQFSQQGIRQIELDTFADPNGGLYAKPVLGPPGGLNEPEMLQPGFKVLHSQDADWETTCTVFVACLRTVKSWSDANPGHAPIMILIEAKDGPVKLPPGAVVPIVYDTATFDALDAEIRSVFSDDEMITPDDVRGTHATLEEAVLAGDWPTLGESRGKVLFNLDNADKRATYASGHPSLQGRILFTNAQPGEPEAAFVERNDAKQSQAEIVDLVKKGYVVRTRADADTVEARTNDTSTSQAALASGAQWVSTDYPVPDPALNATYQVTIPGGTPGRCNPIIATTDCVSTDIENPDYLSSR